MSEAIALRPVLTFRLANQFYALSIEQVLEVAAMVTVTKLSDSPPEVLGIANRHGEVLPLLDLRVVFKLPAAAITVATLFIVVQVAERQVGLVVDEVRQVKYIRDEALKPTRGAGQYVTHIVGEDDALFQMVDVAALLAIYFPG